MAGLFYRGRAVLSIPEALDPSTPCLILLFQNQACFNQRPYSKGLDS